MEHLSIKEVHDRLSGLKGWEIHGWDAIAKTFEFQSFKEAVDFSNKVSDEAQKINHYPQININNSKVEIVLTTKKANGLTYEDFKLARIIEQLL